MQQIKDTFNSLSTQAGGAADAAGNKLNELAGSEEMKKLMPYLVSGGLGAGAGALLTGKRRARKGESRTSHLGRVLGNALIAGGLTAGSHALLSKGVASASGKDVQDHISPELPDEGPLAANLRTAAFSPLTAGAAGVGGLMATSKLGLLGNGHAQVKMDRENFIKKMNAGGGTLNESDITSMPTSDLQDKMNTASNRPAKGTPWVASANDTKLAEELKRLRQRGGIAGGDTKLQRILSNISRRGPLSTFGQTTPRRIGRGALGLTAAAVPSMLGALLTTDKSQPDD
jgi:hypothetical protein